jgi:hypothetical protein
MGTGAGTRIQSPPVPTRVARIAAFRQRDSRHGIPALASGHCHCPELHNTQRLGLDISTMAAPPMSDSSRIVTGTSSVRAVELWRNLLVRSCEPDPLEADTVHVRENRANGAASCRAVWNSWLWGQDVQSESGSCDYFRIVRKFRKLAVMQHLLAGGQLVICYPGRSYHSSPFLDKLLKTRASRVCPDWSTD